VKVLHVHAVEFVTDRTLWDAASVQAYPLRNDINITSLQPINRYALNQESGIGVMPNWN
jgi:hypothetical protein